MEQTIWYSFVHIVGVEENLSLLVYIANWYW